ncbi:cytochrome bo3 quinol oxidase subunit 2 [Methylobacillus rhizosphaerae]|uniref:Ubiquinol oxidase subunit 2 n=1 Tax=Methylobacillus rhizosphaerae TaxID=551994 RepID=A0A239B557_9PROT|nr:ubiquinol oxidase subunit II [Methylobacillus rhizosphaerae]SNS03000.1 cytochrome bo3 quinol oxidase subunit 2 [Methylobacillus rhizosphaerae]
MIKKRYPGLFSLLSILGTTLLLSGCDFVLFDPKGQIGVEERSLIITATLLMLIVVIPVIIMTLVFAWRYRASNTKATYTPDWSHSNKIEAVVWTVPVLIILALGTITWKTTHSLDPRQPIDSEHPHLTVQVVSLDWKWLFIYPEQGIATVNELAFPVDVPVRFEVTSASVMNSFFIPQLGSQIYAMAGMKNTLHLIANEEGVYHGLSANYSGHGFSGMKFNATVTSQEKFDEWVQQVKQSSLNLDTDKYAALEKASYNNPVERFSNVTPNFYDSIVERYTHSSGSHTHSHSEGKE